MIGAPPSGLALTGAQIAAIRAAAEVAYPHEFCALLIGVDREPASAPPLAEVTRVVFAPNVDPHPDRGFELDPSVLVREMRALRERAGRSPYPAERLLGHVHSHPDGPARPSARDLAQAFETGQVWMIVPVLQGKPGTPEAFLADLDAQGRALFRPIGLIEADGAALAPPRQTP
jgi:proteasome lid subunit RPN8/RPN11